MSQDPLTLVRFGDVVGHDEPIRRLREAVATRRLPPALLILGPDGIGKRRVADALLARLLCDAPLADDVCGTCGQCIRIRANTHPDRHVIVRDATRRDIRVEQVRELWRWLPPPPLMATHKVAIVDGAHLLSAAGQNALLKTLEEPPAATVLVLVAPAASLVLPTVRSRCQAITLAPLPREAVARILEARGTEAGEAAVLAGLGDGSPGRAIALAEEGGATARDTLLPLLPTLATADASRLAQVATRLAETPPAIALAVAVAWYRDLLEGALGCAETPRSPDPAAVRAAVERLAPALRLRQLEAVCDTIRDIERNANRGLALETMLLRLRQLERGQSDSVPWTTNP